MNKMPLEKNPKLEISYWKDYGNWWRNIKEVEYATAYIYCFDKNSTEHSVHLYIKSGKITYCSLIKNGHLVTWDKEYILNYLNENQHRVFSIYKDIDITFKHDVAVDENNVPVSSHGYSFDAINIYSIDGYQMEAPYQYD